MSIRRLIYVCTNVKSDCTYSNIYNNVWIRSMEQRYKTEVWNKGIERILQGGIERPWSRSLFRTSYFDLPPSKPPKVVRNPGVFNILTSKCPSRHNAVHFFDIRTSKKWSEHGVFCIFWLRNVLRATTAYAFSTSQLPKMVRAPGVFKILTSKCTSYHNGVQFFDISTSKSSPNPLCF